MALLVPLHSKMECREGRCPSVAMAKLKLASFPNMIVRRVRGVMVAKDVVSMDDAVDDTVGMDMDLLM